CEALVVAAELFPEFTLHEQCLGLGYRLEPTALRRARQTGYAEQAVTVLLPAAHGQESIFLDFGIALMQALHLHLGAEVEAERRYDDSRLQLRSHDGMTDDSR